MALVERPVEAAEIDRVFAFFRFHKGPQHILGRDREFLVWQFDPERCRGFEQAGLSAVTLWDGNDIVGFLGVIGAKFNRDGAIIDGGWLCNLIVLPDYRAVGGWMRLMKAVHRLPVDALGVVTFPPQIGQLYRAMGYYIRDRLFRFVRIVDTEQTAQIVTGEDWRAELDRSIGSATAPDLFVQSLKSLDASWDRFWQRFAERGYFGTNRDSNYITWRYLRHPRMQHTLKVALSPDSDICGAAIYRIEQVKDNPVRVMRLLEMLALDDAAYACLLQAVTQHGEDLGVAFIDHYSTQALHEIFCDAGWFEEDAAKDTVLPGLFQPLVQARRTMNVGVRLLGPSATKDHGWSQSLHVVKSDGDQDRPS
jgi:hypothetical protein